MDKPTLYYYKTIDWVLAVTDNEEEIIANNPYIHTMYVTSVTKEEVDRVIRENDISGGSMLLTM